MDGNPKNNWGDPEPLQNKLGEPYAPPEATSQRGQAVKKAVLVIVGILTMIIGVVFGGYWLYQSSVYTGYEKAIYDQFELTGNAAGYFHLRAGEEDPSGGDNSVSSILYIRAPDGAVYQLKLLTQDIIEKSFTEYGKPDGAKHYDSMGVKEDYYEFKGFTGFMFKNGRLKFTQITNTPFEIGTSPQGPFVHFPIERQKAFEIFGKPNDIHRAKWGSGPP